MLRHRSYAELLFIFLICFFVAVGTASARTLGERPLKKGHKGDDVITLQRVLGLKGYSVGGADGVFGRRTKVAVKAFQRRRGLTRDGIVGPATVRALAGSWRVRRATYYGPGLYGNKTACGQTLRRRTRGVAHRHLPCGSKVAVYHGGRIAIFPVIDRGPHSNGVHFDLTAAAARKVGMSATVTLRAGY